MKTLKAINRELALNYKYYKFVCEYCHESVVMREDEIDDGIYKCCNCGHYNKVEELESHICDVNGKDINLNYMMLKK